MKKYTNVVTVVVTVAVVFTGLLGVTLLAHGLFHYHTVKLSYGDTRQEFVILWPHVVYGALLLAIMSGLIWTLTELSINRRLALEKARFEANESKWRAWEAERDAEREKRRTFEENRRLIEAELEAERRSKAEAVADQQRANQDPSLEDKRTYFAEDWPRPTPTESDSTDSDPSES